MRYHVFFTQDDQVFCKLSDYIENENPGFFGENAHIIKTAYRIDTDDLTTLKSVFKCMQSYGYKPAAVREFCKSINVDYDYLMANGFKNPIAELPDSPPSPETRH